MKIQPVLRVFKFYVAGPGSETRHILFGDAHLRLIPAGIYTNNSAGY